MSKHTRIVYGILDLFDELGGTFEFVIQLMAFFLLPYSRFHFLKVASEKIFKAEVTQEEAIKNTLS